MESKILTFQYALNPTQKQEESLKSHSGAVRYAYNWALEQKYADWHQAREAKTRGEIPEYKNWSYYSLRKEFNKVKNEIAPWWSENSKEAYNTGFQNADLAFKKYIKKQTGLPQYKRKDLNNSEGIIFSTGIMRLEDDHRHLTVPKIKTIKLFERAKKLAWVLNHGGRIVSITVKYQRTRWFASVVAQVTDEVWLQYHSHRTKYDRKRAVGVDVGIKSAAVFSDGTVIENLRAYEKSLKKLKRLNRKFKRQQGLNKDTGELPSKRRDRTQVQLRKAYAHVSNIEIDYAHKLSKSLVDKYQIIGLEDLNVVGMIHNHKLARRVLHASFGRIKAFTKYKAEWYGNILKFVDRFYPSSKKCSDCGTVRTKLSLSERTYHCENKKCGLVLDRDLNAARNIEDEAIRLVHVAQSCGETINGHRGKSSGHTLTSMTKLMPNEVSRVLVPNHNSGS